MAALDLGWGNYVALSIYGCYAGAGAVAVLFLLYGGEMLVNDLNAINTMEHHAPAPDITICCHHLRSDSVLIILKILCI